MQCVKPFARTPCGLGFRGPVRVSRNGLALRSLATRTRAEPEKDNQTSRASVVRHIDLLIIAIVGGRDLRGSSVLKFLGIRRGAG
jgi:hypothetical protein